ncbi:hypothetical protein ZIOFF_055584 [Zingiber officinale]|uniref:Uncharacterized protein n=1 Tax=Zingiber officinale TaxID=94328 RepID=A0A8J5FM11_ZINOF|nr:hypothetical protein ZIOFF_055584 [Zingiber officinale]
MCWKPLNRFSQTASLSRFKLIRDLISKTTADAVWFGSDLTGFNQGGFRDIDDERQLRASSSSESLAMAAISSFLVCVRDPSFQAHPGILPTTGVGNTLKTLEKSFVTCHPLGLSSAPLRQMRARVITPKRQLILRSAYREGGRPNTASTFIGGFLLGGMMVGTLACVYAPKISKALAGTDKKELMRKLPKFIYDEEKALEFQLGMEVGRSICEPLQLGEYSTVQAVSEGGWVDLQVQKTRKVLTQKIEELNSAIDQVSSEIHGNDKPNGVTVSPNEIEAAI